MAEDDLLPPSPEHKPPTPTPPGTKIRCGFCESALTGAGEVIRLSDRAKALRDFEDDLQDAKRDLDAAAAQVAAHAQTIRDLEGKIAALTAPKKGSIEIR